MTFTEKDMQSIATLIRLEVDGAIARRLDPFEERMERFRSETQATFEQLLVNDEKREQEYLMLTAQMGRVESDVAVLKSDVAVLKSDVAEIKHVVSSHDERIQTLEQKCA